MPPQQPFSRAHPLAAFTKSIFMRILKNIALQILWKQQNSEKKNICTLAWGVFFFCLFPNQSQCAKHLTETDLPNQLISRDWSAVCAVCITITALLHCQTLEAAQAAIFEKRLTFKHCQFEQCGRALPLVYMYTLFKVIVLFSKSHTCSQSLPSQLPNRQQSNKMQFIQGNVFIPTTSVPSDPLSVEQLPQQVVTLHWMLQAS